jgi:hypothetical protein
MNAWHEISPYLDEVLDLEIGARVGRDLPLTQKAAEIAETP